MKVVDLRNVFTNCNDVLIEISGDKIYYAEEKLEEGRQSLFLLEYNRSTGEEQVLANYLVQKPGFVMHYFAFPEDFLIVMEDGGGEAWVLRLQKNGMEKSYRQVTFAGNYSDCCALDESHLLFYAGESERDAALFREYRKHTGSTRAAYLYDVDLDFCRGISDRRVCSGAALVPFMGGGVPQLLLLQPHGAEEEKEHCYRNRRWLGDHVDDSVWMGVQSEVLHAVETDCERLPLEQFLRAGTDGLVRYAGQDETSLYFRALHFPKDDQRLIAVNKETLLKTVAADLTLRQDDGDARFVIDQDCRVFKISREEEGFRVQGILNSQVDAAYSEELGEFITCIENRYILARYEMKDATDAFVFYSFYDLQTGKSQSYEGDCAVRGNTVVLF